MNVTIVQPTMHRLCVIQSKIEFNIIVMQLNSLIPQIPYFLF